MVSQLLGFLLRLVIFLAAGGAMLAGLVLSLQANVPFVAFAGAALAAIFLRDWLARLSDRTDHATLITAQFVEGLLHIAVAMAAMLAMAVGIVQGLRLGVPVIILMGFPLAAAFFVHYWFAQPAAGTGNATPTEAAPREVSPPAEIAQRQGWSESPRGRSHKPRSDSERGRESPAPQDLSTEQHFNKVFMLQTRSRREELIEYYREKFHCSREKAMRHAIDDWVRDNR
jgi:hypothetical protein